MKHVHCSTPGPTVPTSLDKCRLSIYLSFWFPTSLLYLFLFILITNIHLYYLFQIITHTLTMWIIQPRRASLVGYNKVSIVLYQMLSFSKKLKVFFTMLITENIETLEQIVTMNYLKDINTWKVSYFCNGL